MNSLEDFFKDLIGIVKIDLKKESLTIKEQQQIISNLNNYLYTNYENIGTTTALEKEFEYFSEFHKYWENKHKEIINPQIDEKQCEKAAESLHFIYIKYGKKPFQELYDTCGLNKAQICKIRFFTATQDFRGSRKFKDFAKIYADEPDYFDSNFCKYLVF